MDVCWVDGGLDDDGRDDDGESRVKLISDGGTDGVLCGVRPFGIERRWARLYGRNGC